MHSGIGKNKPKPDLALFYSETSCRAAGVFTRNQVKAAPVVLSQARVRSGRARAVLINSGNANACTGARGMKDAVESAALAAKCLGVSSADVLVASTGVIGHFLPMMKMRAGIWRLCRAMRGARPDPMRAAPSQGSGTEEAPEARAVRAMMTTDTVPKFEERSVRAGGRTYKIWGCVKGAGMIHPDMATMLSVLLTDAQVPSAFLKAALKRSVDESFNCASVDGDTSTNDSVYLLANGASGAALSSAKDLKAFEAALSDLCLSLARRMVRDGEGATKLVEITVTGARTPADAKKAAVTVATSPLVKTAFFGNDANWGRIFAALGRSGAKLAPNKIKVAFGPLKVADKGVGLNFSEKRALAILKKDTVPVSIDLGVGKARAKVLTCDFSFDYVKINAEYRT
ncbi:MAG: bifunctional ornithine acetyltransferase/N-acetylglutamate synthase [Elusimicrobia bacterium RIFCSPLOWO2_01_FULL_60_11]|nr:MAG: bifunctional ornithine acetyltransferase/N-acetylglutamate synthase [Elusimicrobia bacterium RIFCSPLOWO2_01_FULL_60_11]